MANEDDEVILEPTYVGESPPVYSSEARERQLINLAFDAIERRIRDGSATSAELVALMRLGTQRAKAEQEMLRRQIELYTAKTESLRMSQQLGEMFSDAMAAFAKYGGQATTYERMQGDGDGDEEIQ